MKYNSEIQHRRSIRLPEYDYSQCGAYFLTIVTRNREHLFGEIVDGKMELNELGKIVEQNWNEIPNHYPDAKIDEYIIMPNHIHGIIIFEGDVGAIRELPLQKDRDDGVGAIRELPLQIQRRKMLLPKIIGYFKMNSAKQINIIHQKTGNPVWQRNYYEHIIRNEEELNRIREYIIDNPKNWENDEENCRGNS